MFRCAVVSRKHAKIAFSDSGHVYLIDLNSHHGTHIRKPGEALSKMLKPETPTQLADGDVVTFGKSVGRHNECVRPVVARIQLLSEPPFTPITPPKPISYVDLTKPTTAYIDLSKPTSGRYGVYVPGSPSSSDASSGFSDDDDIHEIPPASGPNALPLLPRGNRTTGPSSPIGRAFEALKRLLPPAPITTAPESPDSDSSSRDWPSSPINLDIPKQLRSPLYSPYSADWTDWPSARLSPRYTRSPSPRADSLFTDQPCEEHQEEHERSRSTSPMDLASPSPEPEIRNPQHPNSARHDEPSLVGAWPASRSSTPPPASVTVSVSVHPSPDPDPQAPDSQNDNDSATPPAASASASASATSAEASVPSAMSIESICSEPISDTREASPQVHADPSSPGPEPIGRAPERTRTEDVVGELQGSLKRLQDEVARLQTHRRKYKSRFNTNAHLIADKLADLDAQYVDLAGRVEQYADLAERVEVELPELQVQVDELREQAEGFFVREGEADVLADREREGEGERSEVRASVETLRELVLEMRNLRTATQEQMNAELEAVRVARDAALAKIAAQVEARMQAQAQVQAAAAAVNESRKRKRDDSDEESDADADERPGAGEGADVDVRGGGVADVMMAEAAGLTTPTTPTLATGDAAPATTPCRHPEHHCAPPPAKRARRFAAVAVHTATAVTVGAIATWSALAFS
ncbi:hypothetical protein H0H81_005261 [Sphagnurus paluster]|uniref:FHA domain-containing protein n=1 Tax=Sphagnurus paluster TaxID=117069 RepID=A0A9P7GKM8_9AGAR|nr:hypothetical protein H0H81_005261 [Sphagnurus paluster]